MDMKPAQTLQLPAVLDFNAAAPLHERLLALRGTDIEVDASIVERIGGQCLQILLSAKHGWEREKLSFSVAQASEAFSGTLAAMGVAADLSPVKEA
jgi:chemotaxis protein CheX